MPKNINSYRYLIIKAIFDFLLSPGFKISGPTEIKEFGEIICANQNENSQEQAS